MTSRQYGFISVENSGEALNYTSGHLYLALKSAFDVFSTCISQSLNLLKLKRKKKNNFVHIYIYKESIQ